jgi:hypothetical protein
VLFSPSLNDLGDGDAMILEHLFPEARHGILREEHPQSCVLPDTISQLWREFPRLIERDVAVWRYLGDLRGDPLARFKNGKPMVSLTVDAAGHAWIACATPLGTTEANNLCETGFYVPFLDRLSRYALSRLKQDATAWYAGVSRKNPLFGADQSALVYDIHDALIDEWRAQPRVTIDAPGLYRIQASGRMPQWIAVGIDPRESAMVFRAPHIPDRSAASVRYFTIDAFLAFLRNRGAAITTYLLWGLLALMCLVEILLWESPAARKKTASVGSPLYRS